MREAPRVLVVEDSPTFRYAIATLLADAGYRVEQAGGGGEAFDRCRTEPFDAVVSDVRMDAISGVQLCRLLRHRPETSDLPVVLLTAASDPRSRFWGTHAGAAAYVPKGQARASLLPELERVLAGRPPRRAPPRGVDRRSAGELLSEVLDELLFESVIAAKLRALAQESRDRCSFASEVVRLVAGVVDSSVVVLRLSGGERAPVSAAHSRLGWPHRPGSPLARALGLGEREEEELLLEVATGDGSHPDPRMPEAPEQDVVRVQIGRPGSALGELRVLGRLGRPIDEDRATLARLAVELTLPVENLLLFEATRRMARSDGLTGLDNRRSMEEELDREAGRSRRTGVPFSVLLLDVDHFKQVNDRYGHAVGDAVLRAIAGALRGAARSSDRVARWGGEEFLLLLPGADGSGALRLAERVRRSVAALPAVPEGPPRVTASLGLATFAGDASVEGMLERADAALYRAKAGGRDRVFAA